MKLVAFITPEQQNVIEKILTHLGEPTETERATGPPKWALVAEAQAHVDAHPDWYPEPCYHDHGEEKAA
ncbi:MAG: hypothetical protein ABII12_09960 [Planctomycetota bacterium]